MATPMRLPGSSAAIETLQAGLLSPEEGVLGQVHVSLTTPSVPPPHAHSRASSPGSSCHALPAKLPLKHSQRRRCWPSACPPRARGALSWAASRGSSRCCARGAVLVAARSAAWSLRSGQLAGHLWLHEPAASKGVLWLALLRLSPATRKEESVPKTKTADNALHAVTRPPLHLASPPACRHSSCFGAQAPARHAPATRRVGAPVSSGTCARPPPLRLRTFRPTISSELGRCWLPLSTASATGACAAPVQAPRTALCSGCWGCCRWRTS
jgi:hypothetical protein